MENQKLKNSLLQFTGSERLYRYHNILLTEGVYYLANAAQCFWLMDLVWSHVNCGKWINQEAFIHCKLVVSENRGVVTFDDGNKKLLASQNIPYTDFPLEGIQLFIVQQGSQYIVMLPNEY